jgi:hypothetical protein
MAVTRWLTLFDPLDDLYDGDLREDDFEAPRVKLHFQIKRQGVKNESGIVTKSETRVTQ